MRIFSAGVAVLACVMNLSSTGAFRTHSTVVGRALFSRSISRHFSSTGGQVENPGGGEFKRKEEVIALRQESLQKILGDELTEGAIIEEATGGANNIMDFITLKNGKKYVLRIYNNGCNSPVVEFEDVAIQKLIEVSKGQLSFAVPTAVPSKFNGKTHVKLANGAECIMFDLIPGELPKKTRAKAIGRACGELVNALEKCDLSPTYTVDQQPNTRFYEIYKQHWMTTRENFFGALKDREEFNASPDVRKYVDLLGEEVIMAEGQLQKMHDSNLPVQLIHADLHYDNVLVEGDKVSGLLDFEFAAIDWRACELAVALSKYAGEAEALDYFKDFSDGYAETSALTKDEVSFIPDLIILRILSNVVFFVGRGISDEDSMDALTTRAEMYYQRIQWIKDNKQKIVDIVGKTVK